ncbi:MAG: type II toxin-antitoxin system HicB family antitoxin [Thermosynechococcaceae cyanobacterium]
MQNIQLKVEIFQEDNLYVGICPALNVSSFGETVTEAKKSVQEALEAFIEECTEMQTLTDVLDEAGLTLKDGLWVYPQPIAVEMVTL